MLLPITHWKREGLCQHPWACHPSLEDFTKALGWEASAVLWCQPLRLLDSAAVCTILETHALIVLGTGTGNPHHSRLAAPAPQPASGLPPSLPPLSGRAAKLPAASKAYCSAVTRNGCGAQHPPGERLEAEGGGWGELGKCPRHRLPWGAGLCAGRSQGQTHRLCWVCPLLP